jgi:hypothetical protein
MPSSENLPNDTSEWQNGEQEASGEVGVARCHKGRTKSDLGLAIAHRVHLHLWAHRTGIEGPQHCSAEAKTLTALVTPRTCKRAHYPSNASVCSKCPSCLAPPLLPAAPLSVIPGLTPVWVISNLIGVPNEALSSLQSISHDGAIEEPLTPCVQAKPWLKERVVSNSQLPLICFFLTR